MAALQQQLQMKARTRMAVYADAVLIMRPFAQTRIRIGSSSDHGQCIRPSAIFSGTKGCPIKLSFVDLVANRKALPWVMHAMKLKNAFLDYSWYRTWPGVPCTSVWLR